MSCVHEIFDRKLFKDPLLPIFTQKHEFSYSLKIQGVVPQQRVASSENPDNPREGQTLLI